MRRIVLFLFLCASALLADAQVMSVIGDSYVANHRRPKEETWHYKLADEMGLVYKNYGRNGSCVAFDRTRDGKYNFGPAMWKRYVAIDPESDYVLIIAGHNDADKVRENKDSLDMFTDSLRFLISGIREICPKAKIGYVTPWYVDRPGFRKVCETIRSVCKEYDVPVLYNYDKRCVIQVRDRNFRRNYFQGVDDKAHLNEKGHELFLPVARKWFMKKMR